MELKHNTDMNDMFVHYHFVFGPEDLDAGT